MHPDYPQLEKGLALGSRYEIVDLIGRGGSSYVYRAQDRILGRIVALKQLHEPFSDDDRHVARFRREAMAVGKLNHPHLVMTYDTGIDRNVHFIVQEYVEGKSIKDWIVEYGPLSVSDTVKLGLKVAETLSYIHSHDVLHRDIKPSNIMLQQEHRFYPWPHPRIADFGIAKQVNQTNITILGTTVGTEGYIPPELRFSQTKATETSDIYALGKTLYVAANGELPLRAMNGDIIHDESKSELELSLLELIQDAIADHPDHRIQTADALVKRLQEMPTEDKGPAEVPKPAASAASSTEGLDESSFGSLGSDVETAMVETVIPAPKRLRTDAEVAKWNECVREAQVLIAYGYEPPGEVRRVARFLYDNPEMRGARSTAISPRKSVD